MTVKCEFFDGCQVYKNGGEVACKINFCNDTCPPIPNTASATGSIDTAATAGNTGTVKNARAKKLHKKGKVRRSLGEGGRENV